MEVRREARIAAQYDAGADAVLHAGDCRELLRALPDGAARLVVTSPPYNLGKAYEQRQPLAAYLAAQEAVIADCVRVLADDGSICWQLGNHVDGGEVFPLDVLLYPVFKRHGLPLRPLTVVGPSLDTLVLSRRSAIGCAVDPHLDRRLDDGNRE
jgi:adenine-specific DNA-methyltransferase